MSRTNLPVLIAALLLLGIAIGIAPSTSAQDTPLDCADYPNQAAAQVAYREDPSDLADNDGDDDGLACELVAYDDAATDTTPVETTSTDVGDAVAATASTPTATTPSATATTSSGTGEAAAATSQLPSTGVGVPTIEANGWASLAVAALLALGGGALILGRADGRFRRRAFGRAPD